MKHIIPLLALFIMLTSACTPELPGVTPQPVASATSSAFSGALYRLATQTQGAMLTATAETQQGAPTVQEITAVTPSPLPTLSPSLDNIGPFQQISRQEAPIVGNVINMQTDQEGNLFLLSESGYSRFKDDQWTAYFIGETGYLVGVDREGRGWAVTYDGAYISRWESRSDDIEVWIAYSEKEGWLPSASTPGNPVSPGLFTNGNGNLWLATAQDVRRFDGDRWESFNSQALGMPPIADGSHASFTIYPMPEGVTVYVGRCDWGTAGITGGGGLRKLDGNNWTISDPVLESGCISAFTQDAVGNLWVAQDDNLYRLNSPTGILERVPLPEAPAQKRLGYTLALTPDPDGSLWAQFPLCDGAACFGDSVLFHLKEGAWQMVGEPSPMGGMKLLFDATGTAWTLYAGGISQIVGDDIKPLLGLTVLTAATDSNGKLWLVAQSNGPPTLWAQP